MNSQLKGSRFSLPNLLHKKQEKEVNEKQAKLLNKIDKVFREHDVSVAEALTIFEVLAVGYRAYAVKNTKLSFIDAEKPKTI